MATEAEKGKPPPRPCGPMDAFVRKISTKTWEKGANSHAKLTNEEMGEASGT